MVVACATFPNLQVKNLERQPVPSRDAQRILQSDWTGGTTRHTQPKVIVSDAAFT